jgi:hypothetical protein
LANDDYNVCVSWVILSLYFYNIIRVLKYNLIKLNRKINRKMDKNFDELLMIFDEFSKGKIN